MKGFENHLSQMKGFENPCCPFYRVHFIFNNKKPRNRWYQNVSRFLAEKEGVEPYS